jgi:alkylation response protein AidB-like acyl-CoA dehydrogenase
MSLSKFEESTAAIGRWASSPKPSGREGWIARAAEAPLILKIDGELTSYFDAATSVTNTTAAASRDVEGKTPVTEIALLKAAGLVNLLGPVEFGGAGETWETSYKITTEIAKADGSIGHLLGNHYSW